MALWQIFDADGIAQAEQFDDGLAFMPGEEGFSTDAVANKAGDGGYSLIGVPNWHLRVEAEQKVAAAAEKEAEEAEAILRSEEAAKARIAQLIDPEGTRKAQAETALRAECTELSAYASEAEKAKLETLFAERIDAL